MVKKLLKEETFLHKNIKIRGKKSSKYDEVECDIQKGNDILLDQFGSQEKVDEYLNGFKQRLYKKLFKDPIVCNKENCKQR